MPLQANSDTSFYLNGELVDTVMLNYQVDHSPLKGKIHKMKQAVSFLRIMAGLLKLGDTQLLEGTGYTEEDVKRWIKECSTL